MVSSEDTDMYTAINNAARRTGICLKRRHCAIPVFSIVVVRHIRVAFVLYAALSVETEVMVQSETGRATNMPISRQMVRDVVIRFCRANLTVCRFFLALVIGE